MDTVYTLGQMEANTKEIGQMVLLMDKDKNQIIHSDLFSPVPGLMERNTDRAKKPLRMGPTTMENGPIICNKGRDNLLEPTREFTQGVGLIISSMVTER